MKNKKIIVSVFIAELLLVAKNSIAQIKYEPLVPGPLDQFIPTGNTQLSNFLGQAFQFGLAISAALAVVMIVWGGIEIMLSESIQVKSNGKQRIQGAIWGLLLALTSWLILYIINPAILNFNI